jgi:hypothetical protein
MAVYTAIDNPELFHQVKLYTGNYDTNAITLDGTENMQPDWVWIKERSSTSDHSLHDSVRTSTKIVKSSTNAAEITRDVASGAPSITAFNSDGFTLGANNGVNENSQTYVAWCWKAGGSASSNSNGGISSSVSASTTAGFSIVTWTGNGSDATVGHGLSSAVQMYAVKNRDDAADWRIGQTVAGNTMTAGNGYYMEWNDTKASTNPGSAVTWGSTPTAPTASVFTVGSNNAHNGSSDNMLAYCFHSVQGYSKIGQYVGLNSSNGNFVYLGFRPKTIFLKRVDSAGDWRLYDDQRDGFNQKNDYLEINTNVVESDTDSGSSWDLLSNGFKFYTSEAEFGGSGTYFYMAFAHSPLVNSKGVPNNPRG